MRKFLLFIMIIITVVGCGDPTKNMSKEEIIRYRLEQEIDKTYPKLRKKMQNKKIKYMEARNKVKPIPKEEAESKAIRNLKSRLKNPDSLKIKRIVYDEEVYYISFFIDYEFKDDSGRYVRDFYIEKIDYTYDGGTLKKIKEEYKNIKSDYDRKLNKIFGEDGFNIFGYNEKGYDREGYDKNGYDIIGYSKKGYNKFGYNKEGYDEKGYNKIGFNKKGEFDNKPRYLDAKIKVGYENLYNDFGEKIGKDLKSIKIIDSIKVRNEKGNIINFKNNYVKLEKNYYGNILHIVGEYNSHVKVSYIKAYVNGKKILQKKYNKKNVLKNDFIFLINKYPKLDIEICYDKKVAKIRNINTKKYRKIINEFKD